MKPLPPEPNYFTVIPLTQSEIFSRFSPREPQSHKGTFGTLVMICGSYGMVGAAAMAAKAALRCGVGLVHLVTTQACYPLLASMLPQAVFVVLDNWDEQTPTLSPQNESTLRKTLARADACLIGCGLGAEAMRYLPLVVEVARCPVVADADALNFLAKHPDLFRQIQSPWVLTPHPAEMGRLADMPTQDVQQHRAQVAMTFARAHDVITVLKGAGTLIAHPDGTLRYNPTGNAGMAKGGSGDVLAGMLGAFLAQDFSPMGAAICAVYLHGMAGDLCAETLSQIAMLPTDLIDMLPRCFLQIEQHMKRMI